MSHLDERLPILIELRAENDWLRNEMATNMIYKKDADELRAEIERLQAQCKARGEWGVKLAQAEAEIDRLEAALLLSQSQNYCTLCGRALDGEKG